MSSQTSSLSGIFPSTSHFFTSPSEGKPTRSGVDLYARFAFAGAVCCGVTHGALTPGKNNNNNNNTNQYY